MRRADLERNPTSIPVVAAAIVDAAGRLLLQQALPHKRHGGMWEFPGGKVESEETQRFALCREVREELGIELDEASLTEVGSAEEPAADGRPALVLFLYKSLQWRGEPQALEGQAWGWFTPDEARELSLPPMDRALLDQFVTGPPA